MTRQLSVRASNAPIGADRGDRRTTALFVVGSGTVSALVFWLAHASLIDDAYITLSYAKNMARDLHWGLTPQQVSNTATSPGNVLLLAGATAALGIFGGLHPVLGLGAVSVVCGSAYGWAWARIVHRLALPRSAGVLGVVLVLLNPVLLSAIGLEVLPIAAVLALLLAVALDDRPIVFGVLGGVALLIRLDLVVFVILLGLAAPGVRRKLPLAVAGVVLVGAPWYVWSWFFFGSAVPDTFVIKTLQESFDGVSFGDGPVAMFGSSPVLTAVEFLPALAGTGMLVVWVVATVVRRSARLLELVPAAAVGSGGIVYYVVYSTLHVPPYHWYYVPSIVSLTIFAAVAAGALAADPSHPRALAVSATAGLALVAVATVVLVAGQGAPWRTTLIFGNWATTTDYTRVGTEIGDRVGDAVVRNPGEIGILAYFCECAMVNDFTDRGVVVPLVDKRIQQAGPIGARLLRWNYRNLDRTQVPRVADYELRYEAGPGSGADVWDVYAPGRGIGHLSLVPVS